MGQLLRLFSSGPAVQVAQRWYRRACDLEARSPSRASAAYECALALDPDHFAAHTNLGRLHHEAGELGAAEAHYRRALASAPHEATCWYNLGVLLEDTGRELEAIDAYRGALDRQPDLADAHYNLARLLERQGKRSSARRHDAHYRRLNDDQRAS
jgi:tetratricopeptide (TPR) repeat protein